MLSKQVRACRRKNRVRAKIVNTTRRTTRLVISKSNCHISCQIVDDTKSITLLSASSMEKTVRQQAVSNCNRARAKDVGLLIAQRAVVAGISKVVFDRGSYKYHGVIQAFCEAARTKLDF